jgi:hypothetical protein
LLVERPIPQLLTQRRDVGDFKQVPGGGHFVSVLRQDCLFPRGDAVEEVPDDATASQFELLRLGIIESAASMDCFDSFLEDSAESNLSGLSRRISSDVKECLIE